MACWSSAPPPSTRAAKTAGKVEHAAEGAVAGERAGVKAAEGTATGERTLGSVFDDAGGDRPPTRRASATWRDRPRRTPATGEGAADAAMRIGDESATQEMGRASRGLEGIATPLSRSEALLEGLPVDLRGRVRVQESSRR